MILTKPNANHLCMALALLIGVSSNLATAQFASAIIREGDSASRGTVDSINGTAVNHAGGYAVTANLAGAGSTISTVFGNATGGSGSFLRFEDTIGDLSQTSFESFVGISNAGQIAYSASTDNIATGQTALDSVWLDDALLQNEEDAVAAAPGEFSSFNSRPGITAGGTPYWVGGLTDTAGGTTVDRGLFFDGNLLLRGNDDVGVAEPVAVGSGISFSYRFSALGTNYISPINVQSPTTNDQLVAINGTVVSIGGRSLREGIRVPATVGGAGIENWDNFDFVSINEAGDYFVTGDTDGTFVRDEFVLINGRTVLREGDLIDGSRVDGAIEGGMMNEDRDWAMVWDISDLDGSNSREALIVNGEVVLVEGDQVDWNNDGFVDLADDGFTITDFFGISSLSLSDRDTNGDVTVYFTADATNTGGTELEAALQVTLSTIPEPEGGLLALFALGSIAIFRRRYLP